MDMFSKILLQFILTIFVVDHALGQDRTVTCTYEDVTGKGYACVLKNEIIDGVLTIADGTHINPKTDADVVALIVETSTITNFPRAIFAKFINLKIAELSSVQMTTFGDKIETCAALTTVDLSKNKFTALPDGFFSNCKEITVLKLSENEIVGVNENALNGLEKLDKVHLDGNGITTLSANIFKVNRALTEILLSNNQITTLSADVLKNLNKLETLSLSQNNFTDVPSFEGCTSLKEIHLNLNQLSELKAGIFKSQSKMVNLVLANNTITEIKAASFEKCDALETLDLKSNSIKNIEKEFFDAVPKLKKLELDLNECVSKTFSDIKIEDIKKEAALADCYNSATSLKVSAVLVFLYIFINLLK